MRALKWTLGILLVVVVGGFLHWSLPSRDIVRIIGTEVARTSFQTTDSAGNDITRTRDVRYIQTVWPDGAPRVYRNEDTDWGWPPYFKFDSANLHAEAQNLVSGADTPRWVVVTHYGWRIPMFSMFPNAVAVRPAEGPDERLIPWFNIVVVTLLVVAVLVLRRLLIMAFARGGSPDAPRRRWFRG